MQHKRRRLLNGPARGRRGRVQLAALRCFIAAFIAASSRARKHGNACELVLSTLDRRI
jgi:hypothetical protein